MNKLTSYFPYLAIIFFLAVLLASLQTEPVEEATYSIITDKEYMGVRRSIDVRLDKKVSEEVLRKIARKLKKNERKNYDRTFIFYRLAGMEVDYGAWAISHFDPDLEVRILGLTAEQEENVIREAKSTLRDVVGIWLDERPGAGATVTIYRENTKLYLEYKWMDGSGSVDEMTETQSTAGTKLVEKGGNRHGEYFVLDRNGNLQAGGKDGIFLKYKKLQ